MISQISVITKIVPSPDWFIGLDSVSLCKDGLFIPAFNTEVVIDFRNFIVLEYQAFPMDAGTDNGFTFTSPNWETEPRAEVFQISNRPAPFIIIRYRYFDISPTNQIQTGLPLL